MTVKELISKLEKVENKEKIVLFSDKRSWDNIEVEDLYYNFYIYPAKRNPFDFN